MKVASPVNRNLFLLSQHTEATVQGDQGKHRKLAAELDNVYESFTW